MSSPVDKLDNQRKVDRIAGYWAAFILNVTLILLIMIPSNQGKDVLNSPSEIMIWFPWLANGLIMVISLLTNAQFAIGYLTAIGVLVVATILFVPSCMAACITAEALGLEPDANVNSNNLLEIWPIFNMLYIIFWFLIGVFFTRRYKAR